MGGVCIVNIVSFGLIRVVVGKKLRKYKNAVYITNALPNDLFKEKKKKSIKKRELLMKCVTYFNWSLKAINIILNSVSVHEQLLYIKKRLHIAHFLSQTLKLFDIVHKITSKVLFIQNSTKNTQFKNIIIHNELSKKNPFDTKNDAICFTSGNQVEKTIITHT